ncbi:MAG: hypothetical protein GXO39_07285 [Thermotogae bacterium]|nr:hypothetical protein [Thermotogota bacterium]
MFWFLFVLGERTDLGRVLYERECLSCHKPDNRLEPPAPPLELYRTTEDYVLKIMEEGVPGSCMPRFQHLKEEERRAISRFVASFNSDYNPDLPKELIRRGERIYYDVCAPCHGDDGSGSTFGDEVPPPPDFRRFNPLPERTIEILNSGIPKTSMYSFRDILSERDKRAVAIYILTLFER